MSEILLSYDQAQKLAEKIRNDCELAFLAPLAASIDDIYAKRCAAIAKASSCRHVFASDDPSATCMMCGIKQQSKDRESYEPREMLYTITISG